MDKREELLEIFLGGFPEATHPLDEKRFVAYSIECCKYNSCIDTERIRKAGVPPERLHELEIAHDWIRTAYKMLKDAYGF